MAKNIVDDLLEIPLGKRTFEERVQIKSAGRPKPALSVIQCDGKRYNRAFSSSWYDKYSWLTGSDCKSALLCWPCVLFPSAENQNSVWKSVGYSDIKNLPRSLERHAKSRDHIQADVRLKLLGRQRIDHAIDEGLRIQNEQHNAKVTRNRLILKRLIDITTLLARQEVAFRGHDEGANSANKGNCREQYDHLCKYDELLKSNQDSTIFTGVSKITQNEIIESVAFVVKQSIDAEIAQVPFFAWEIDETTDIACKSQVSIILRYVIGGNVVERFMGFHDVSAGRDATSLEALATRELSKFNFKEKLIAQTYDGAAVMSSELNGLQAKIKGIAPQATFVHCYAHQLNLVLSKGATNIREVRIFFSSLAGISTFFSKSTKRTHVLDSLEAQRLPTNAPTRWNFTSRAVLTVASIRETLIQTFQLIRDSNDFDEKAICESVGFINTLENFQFVFILFVYRNIFHFTDVLYEILQSKSTDIEFCQIRIMSATESISQLRSDRDFNTVYAEVLDLVPEPTIRCANNRNNTEQPSHRDKCRATYFEIFDNILGQLEIRFSDFNKLAFLPLVDVTQFDLYSRSFPEKLYSQMAEIYGKYFDLLVLKSELIVLYSDKELWQDSKSAASLLLFMTENNLNQSMPELTRLLQLVVTIPATSASTERSFSCLKRIKSYTRNTMGQERMSSLSLISIEKKLVKQMEETPEWYTNISNHFASMKDRRLDFHFR